MPERKVSKEDLIKAYEKKGGNISATCAALGISRQAFYNYYNSDKELAEKLDNVKEGLLDFAESKLMAAVGDGNLTAIIFFLKTKGKNRGYVERVENDLISNPFEDLMKSLDEEDDEQ